MTDLVIPQVLAIRKRYEQQQPAIQSHFQDKLQKTIKNSRVKLYWGMGLVGLFLLGGTILALLKTLIALIMGGFIIAGLVIIGIIAKMMLPRMMQTIALRERAAINAEMNRFLEDQRVEMNRHIEAIKEEVRRDPIGFLEADYRRKTLVYERQREAVSSLGGAVEAHVRKVTRRKEDRPKGDYRDVDKAIERMRLFHKNRMERLDRAFTALNSLHEKIEEARTNWEMKKSAAEAIGEERLIQLDEDAAFQEVLSEIAFDTVHTEYETVFGLLEIDAQEMATKQLDFGPGLHINLTKMATPAPTQIS